MAYQIMLTDGNIRSLQWAEDRGYFPEGWCASLEETEDGTYLVPEHVAWELSMFEEEDPDSFLSCMPDDVVSAIRTLMDEVI